MTAVPSDYCDACHSRHHGDSSLCPLNHVPSVNYDATPAEKLSADADERKNIQKYLSARWKPGEPQPGAGW